MSKFSNWLKNYLFEEETQQPRYQPVEEKESLIQKVFTEIETEKEEIVEPQQLFDVPEENLKEEKTQSSFLNIVTTEQPKEEIKPIVVEKTARETYRAFGVISPIFGSQQPQTAESFNQNQIKQTATSSIIGTIFSPINGKNASSSNVETIKPIAENRQVVASKTIDEVKTTNHDDLIKKQNDNIVNNSINQHKQIYQQSQSQINTQPQLLNQQNNVINNKTTIQNVKVIDPNLLAQSQNTQQQYQKNTTLENAIHINKNYKEEIQLKTEPISSDDSVEQFSLF